MIRLAASALLLCSVALVPVHAASEYPPIPETRDVDWAGGAMQLDVDASDVKRGVFKVVQTIPLPKGLRHITLLYPEWEPGHHAPRGPIAGLVDLRFSIDGRPVDWRRDPINHYAFHIDLPDGARELVARFLHTSPLQPSEGRVMISRELLDMQWEHVSLYPAGYAVQRLPVRASATFADGWTSATALDGTNISGNRVTWAQTDYETLVDSPVFAGLHGRRWILGKGMMLSAFADRPEQLSARTQDMAGLIALQQEAFAVFGKPPFDRYEFLVALTDKLGVSGIEHRRSTEIGLDPNHFIEWQGHDWARNVIAHELVHAWNGKYRIPDGLLANDYRQPLRGNMLWLYEGQTQFWGHVLSARSGLQSSDMVIAMIATQAGLFSEQPGRGWRSLEDTGFDPVFAARRPKPYASLARGEDYYNEGLLIWLEADQIIRAGTRGRQGLDDFAARFFAVSDNRQRYRPYGRDEIVATLNAIYPHDWAGFLSQRFDQAGQPAPLAGIVLGGYRLVWKDLPNAYDQARMADSKRLDLTHSLGISIESDGDVVAPQWESPAARAGIVTGARIVAVNGLAYSPEAIKAAITAAKGGNRPIDLLIRRGDRYETVPVAWNGGLRWPWLERTQPRGPNGLDSLLAPRRQQN